MKDNYTNSAKEVLRLAHLASRNSGQNYTGTEHLLQGLAMEKEGVASRVLRENEVTAEQLQKLIGELNIQSGNLALKDQDGLSPRCQKILRMAAAQAQKYKSQKTGTEHMLMAILLEGDNVAAKLIEALGEPLERNYAPSCLGGGEDGELVYEGFTVYTYREGDRETVTDVS